MSHESLATQGHNSDNHLVISLGPIHYRKQGFIRRIQYIRRYPKPTNIMYVHRFGLGTDEYMGRPI
jgi:hypothetical protein